MSETTVNGKTDKTFVEPVIKDKELFAWLEEVFYGEGENAQPPERIELRLMQGKRCDVYGPQLKQMPFAPEAASEEARKKMPGRRAKPKREDIIKLSNQLIGEAQMDCDARRKDTVYGILAWHDSRGDEPYALILRRLSPGKRIPLNGESTASDDEPLSAQERFSVQILTHQKEMIGLVGDAFGGFMDRDDRLIDRLLKRNEYLEARCEKLFDQLERALSLELDRDERRVAMKLKNRALEQGLSMAMTLAPPLLNGIFGKELVKSEDQNPEATTLRNFFNALKEQEDLLAKVVGTYNEDSDIPRIPGVLTYPQAKLLYDVAEGKLSPDELDKVMPGGPHEITIAQVMNLSQIVPVGLLAPIQILVDTRMKRREAAQQKE